MLAKQGRIGAKTSSYMVSSCPPNKTTIPPEIFKPQGVLSLQTQIHFTQCAGLLFASPGDPPGILLLRVRRVQPRRPAAHRAAGLNRSNPRLPRTARRPVGGLLFPLPPGIHLQRVRRVQPRRPAAHRAAGSNYSNPRLPKGKHRPQGGAFLLVTRRGFEPRTHCLKGNCSAN